MKGKIALLFLATFFLVDNITCVKKEKANKKHQATAEEPPKPEFPLKPITNSVVIFLSTPSNSQENST